MAADPSTSLYLDLLPAIFRQDGDELLAPFLLAFQRLLTGVGSAANPGLEEVLEGIGPALLGVERYFDPGPDLTPEQRTPREFLDWLASWVALTLREDWSEEEKRRILADIVPSYQLRGTKEALRRVLAAYTGLGLGNVEIDEFNTPFQVGVTSTVGVNTIVGDGVPHAFRVRVGLVVAGEEDLVNRRRILHAIIDQEKPAHTVYDLEVETPTLQIGVRSTVGVDTILGTGS